MSFRIAPLPGRRVGLAAVLRPLLALACLLASPALHSATFTVTNTGDSGPGSLRQALADAAASAGDDYVNFSGALDGGSILMSGGTLFTNDADGVSVDATNLPSGLTLNAAVVGQRIIENSGRLTLRGLTLHGANIGAEFGGGAVYNAPAGTLSLELCTLSANAAGFGGGLFNDGTATLTGCTVSGNSANHGSALYNRALSGPGGLSLLNCTITGNTAAIDHSVVNAGSIALTHCTVAANLSVGNYGGMRNEPGRAFTIYNSIIGGTLGGNNTGLTDLLNGGALTCNGANICEKAPVNFDAGGRQDNGTLLTATPLLGDLANNGGRTKTLLPLPGSPAIDAISAGAYSADQRGASRPLDGDGNGGAAYDIGAVETANPDLSALTISKGTLSPAFARNTTYYTSGVSNETASITLTPFAVAAGSTIRVKGVIVASGSASAAIPLVEGPNQIPVEVTGGDGFTLKAYLVVVTRVSLQTRTVTTTADSGPGSLRQALLDSAPYDYSSLIAFAPELSGQTILLTGAQLSTGTTPLSVTIDASALPGGLTIQGDFNNRLIDNHTDLNLRAITLRNGHDDFGGAIRNDGALTAERCTFFNSHASVGGAVHTLPGRTASFRQCTFYANSGTNGGAISNLGATELIHCTVSANACQDSGALFNDTGGTLALQNTIVSGNSRFSDGPPDDLFNAASATLTRVGVNLVAALTNNGSLAGSGTISAASPLLGAFAANGGPTFTLKPQPGSPAIDGAVASAETTDQRGFARPADGEGNGSAVADIGAVEVGDAHLSSLSLSRGTLSPAFARTTTAYTSSVGYPTNSTRVTPTTADPASTITVNGTPVASGSASGNIALSVGANTLTTLVTAPDGTTKTYTVTITRADNPDLAGLVLDTGALSPGFAAATTAYTATVPAATASLTLVPTAALPGSTITVNGSPVVSGASSGALPLNFGANPVTLVVTAPDGVTTKSYTVTVYRAYLVTQTGDGGAGSLRQALVDAAANPGGDAITFAPALDGQTLALTNGPLTVNDSAGVTIDSAGLPHGLAIHGGDSDRVFIVNSGGALTLRGLTLAGGFTIATNGGGALLNHGSLVVERCTITGNVAGYGAALFNQPDATATLRYSTLAGNTAVQTGGAIYNLGSVNLVHCTVAGNSVSTPDFAMIRCGGIYNASILGLTNVIVAGNTATSVPDLANLGQVSFAGANIIQAVPNNGGIFSGSGTYIHVDPLLAPLGAYGGPTPTMLLRVGSPARNTAASGATTDQRGFPIVGVADIGAYEAGNLIDFGAWAGETFPVGSTSAESAADFDYDGDGRANLLEYATLTAGASPDSGEVLAFSVAGAQATVVLPVRFAAPDLLYVVERGTTLGVWSAVYTYDGATGLGTPVAGVSASFGTANVTLTDTFIAGQPKVFYRLKITRR